MNNHHNEFKPCKTCVRHAKPCGMKPCANCHKIVCFKCQRYDPFRVIFCIECYAAKNDPNLLTVVKYEQKRTTEHKEYLKNVPLFDDRSPVVFATADYIKFMNKKTGNKLKLKGSYDEIMKTMRDFDISQVIEKPSNEIKEKGFATMLFFTEPYDADLKEYVDRLNKDGLYYAVYDGIKRNDMDGCKSFAYSIPIL